MSSDTAADKEARRHMGYVYQRGPSGRMLLCCDNCGKAGGVTKVRCPLNYCPASALCGPCKVTTREQLREYHETLCKPASAAYKAQEAAKAANPDQWARSAEGDWHPEVPQGMVRVTTHAGTVVMVPKASYNPSVAGFGS